MLDAKDSKMRELRQQFMGQQKGDDAKFTAKKRHGALGDYVPKKKYTVGTLFSGIGGFCRAFAEEGFKVAWANEQDTHACATFRANYPDTRLIEKSITELSCIQDNLPAVDVITAGFPCQPFSVAGEKKGFDDPRGNLFFEITRLLREFGTRRPHIVLLENVPYLIRHDKGRTFGKLRDDLQSCGYWFSPESYSVLNTRDHTDIPQNRERVFMAAVSTTAADWNDFNFPEPVETTRPVREFLDLSEKQDEWCYFTRESQYLPLFEEEMKRGDPNAVFMLRRNYVRENKSNAVFTLMANMGEGGHNIPVIRDDWGIRKLTPRECARLQGFDDAFTFPEGIPLSAKYRQIGNAVTVALVRRLATECARILDESKAMVAEEETA